MLLLMLLLPLHFSEMGVVVGRVDRRQLGVLRVSPTPSPDPRRHVRTPWPVRGRRRAVVQWQRFVCLFVYFFVCAVVAQETCRDMEHTQLGVAGMFDAAETAWLQGVNLYQSTPGMAEVRGCEPFLCVRVCLCVVCACACVLVVLSSCCLVAS